MHSAVSTSNNGGGAGSHTVVSDGSWTYTEADGDSVVVASDGSWVRTETDGDITTVSSDGSWTVIDGRDRNSCKR